jgi:hypothetical protein
MEFLGVPFCMSLGSSTTPDVLDVRRGEVREVIDIMQEPSPPPHVSRMSDDGCRMSDQRSGTRRHPSCAARPRRSQVQCRRRGLAAYWVPHLAATLCFPPTCTRSEGGKTIMASNIKDNEVAGHISTARRTPSPSSRDTLGTC